MDIFRGLFTRRMPVPEAPAPAPTPEGDRVEIPQPPMPLVPTTPPADTSVSSRITSTIQTLKALSVVTATAVQQAKKIPSLIAGLGAVAEGMDNTMSFNPIRWAYGLSQVAAGTYQITQLIWDTAGRDTNQFSQNVRAGCTVIEQIAASSQRTIEQCQISVSRASDANRNLEDLNRRLEGQLRVVVEGVLELHSAKRLINDAITQSKNSIQYFEKEQSEENQFQLDVSRLLEELRKVATAEGFQGDVNERLQAFQEQLSRTTSTLEVYQEKLINRQAQRELILTQMQAMGETMSDAMRQVMTAVGAIQDSIEQANNLAQRQGQVIETQERDLKAAQRKLHKAAILNSLLRHMNELIRQEAEQQQRVPGITMSNVVSLGITGVAAVSGIGLLPAIAVGAVSNWYFNRPSDLRWIRERVSVSPGAPPSEIRWDYGVSHGTAAVVDLASRTAERTLSTTQGHLRIRVGDEQLSLPFNFSQSGQLPLHTLNDISNFLAEKIRSKQLNFGQVKDVILKILEYKKTRGVPWLEQVPGAGRPISQTIKPDVEKVVLPKHMVMFTPVLLALQEGLSEEELGEIMPGDVLQITDRP